MGTQRKLPNTIIGSKIALNKAVAKNKSLPVGTVILSAANAERLNIDNDAYDLCIANQISAKQAYHAAVELARPQRILLKKSVTGFINSLNNCITQGTIPASARVYFSLPVNRKKMPLINTDDRLLAMATIIISGDLARTKAGGIAMNNPTIAEFTIVYNNANPIITAISNTHTLLNNATLIIEQKAIEIKDIITHVWDNVESYYSLIAAPARRVQGRLWGIRYISTGILSIVKGICKGEDGVVLANVKVRIIGANISTLSDASGHFSLNTTLYGDLELEATRLNYEKNIVEFTKEDGVAVSVEVVMTKL